MKKLVMSLLAAAAFPACGAEAMPSAGDVRVLMERVADWQIANPSEHPADDWTQAAWYAGMMALDGVSGSTRFREAMFAAGEKNGWKTGARVYHAGDHAVGQMYCELYALNRDTNLLAGLRERFDFILENPVKTAVGVRTPSEEIKGGLMRWWWCDALFMGPPAWARLYAATGERKYRDFLVKEWKAASALLYDESEHLYFRDETCFDKRETNGKKVFWGRGNGWVLAGLVRVLQALPENDPDRKYFLQQFTDMAAKVVTLQNEDGLWRTSLLDPESYPTGEASGTALFTYALAWGLNQGLLDRATFEPAVLKAWAALRGCVTAEGRLQRVQPIDAEPKDFELTNAEVHGVGALLLAGGEIFRLAAVAASGGAVEVRVTSALDALRPVETIEVGWNEIAPKLSALNGANVAVIDAQTSRVLDSQLIIPANEHVPTSVLFQSGFLPGQSRRFLVVAGIERDQQPPPQLTAFGRFLPERLDDLAWENDRIAYRVYGPALLAAPGETGGSGIDVWCKKVRTPVIDAWYKAGTYDEDQGGGGDFYQVGLTRGCGGDGILVNGRILAATDFATWTVRAAGPVRFIAELQYPPWKAHLRQQVQTNINLALSGDDLTNEVLVAEFNRHVKELTDKEDAAEAAAPVYGQSKTIMLDRGDNLNRITSNFTAPSSDPFPFVIGIAKRPGDGEMTKDAGAGWLAYTEPEAKPNGRIHCALVVPRVFNFSLTEVDGHYAVEMPVGPGQAATYYAGAGWSKGLDFPDHKAWTDYVRRFAARVASPLKVEIR